MMPFLRANLCNAANGEDSCGVFSTENTLRKVDLYITQCILINLNINFGAKLNLNSATKRELLTQNISK